MTKKSIFVFLVIHWKKQNLTYSLFTEYKISKFVIVNFYYCFFFVLNCFFTFKTSPSVFFVWFLYLKQCYMWIILFFGFFLNRVRHLIFQEVKEWKGKEMLPFRIWMSKLPLTDIFSFNFHYSKVNNSFTHTEKNETVC